MTIETIDPVISEAMTSLGIDPATFDDNSIELSSESDEVSSEEPAQSEEGAKEGEEFAESESGEVENKPDGEEKEEAPESQETAKEIQEIEAARKEFEAQKESFLKDERLKVEKEFHEKYAEKLSDYDQLDSFLTYIAEKDPDLFNVFKEEYGAYNKQTAHPMVEKFEKELKSLKEELSQYKASASDDVTRQKLDSEINQVKATIGKDAEAAGIKIDYAAVEDVWADNPKLSFEEAVFAKYGSALAKAMASKAKVASVEKKVEVKPKVATTGALSRSTQKQSFNYKGSTWDQAVMQAMKEVVGR